MHKPEMYLLCFSALERMHFEESQKYISSLKYESRHAGKPSLFRALSLTSQRDETGL
jgi:hypothetical protein